MHHSPLTWTGTRSARIGAAVIVAAFVVAAAGCSSDKKAAAPAPAPSGAASSTASYHGATIVVAGEGQVKGTPDTMTMNVGVQTIQGSAQAALDQNSREATALIATLKSKGVAAKDIQTSNLSISPNFDLHSHITGYTVANTVTVTLHDLAKAGEIIDAATQAAGNDITLNGVALSIDDTSKLLSEARTSAVRQATLHAKELAKAAGMKLGVVRKIDETGSQLPQPQLFAQADLAAGRTAAPIEAGQQQLTVDVSVQFAITN